MRLFSWGRTSALVMVLGLAGVQSAQAQYLVRTFDEGETETNISKPRFTVQNIGSTRLSGFSLHYRFSVDPGKTPVLESGWYLAGGQASLQNIGGGIWDAVLAYPNQILEPGQLFPNSAGVIVGLHHADWSSWDKSDDPSHLATTAFQVNGKVVVEDVSGAIVAGQFPSQTVGGFPQIIVAAREEGMQEANISRIRVVARNVGKGATDALKLEYHFATEGTRKPVLEVYDPAGAKLSLHKVSGRNWRVEIDYSGRRIKAGERTSNLGVSFALHYADWSVWDKTNDYSNPRKNVFTLTKDVSGTTENGQSVGVEPTVAVLAANSVIVSPIPARSMVTAATDASYLLKLDGTVWGWGYANQFSRFGTASRYGKRMGGVVQDYPVQVSELKDIREITASGEHLLALDASGIVWAVGSTQKPQVLAARSGADEMAIGTCDRPTAIGGISGIKQVSTGGWARNMALDQDGLVYQWGMPTNRNEDWVGPPVQIQGPAFAMANMDGTSIPLPAMSAIRACDGISMAMTSTGAVFGWNTVTDVPVRIVASGAKQLACDDDNRVGLILGTDGSLSRVKADYATNLYPSETVTGMGLYAEIVGQSGTLIAKGNDGKVYVWSSNTYNTGFAATPTEIPALAGATSMAASTGHALAILADGSVKALGDGHNGALGNGVLAFASAPVDALISTGSIVLNEKVELGNTQQELVYENNSTSNQTATFRFTGTLGAKVRVVYTNLSATTSAAIPGGTDSKVTPMAPQKEQIALLSGPEPSVNNDNPLAAATATAAAVTSTWKEGDTKSWNVFDENKTGYTGSKPNSVVATTCRKLVSTATRTFLFWVDDAQWGEGNGKINATKLDALAAKLATDQVSVYQSVREVVGEEWGTHGSSAYIAETTTDFNIVLTDLDSDGDPAPGNSYTLGYFWGTDVSIATGTSKSNQALAIYLDSRWLGYVAQGTWSATNSNAMTVYSTCAHEMQHMVYFYQKKVKGGLAGQMLPWPNEMLSMMTEEVLANEMGWPHEAPRWSRLPYWKNSPNNSFTDWYNSNAPYEAGFAYVATLFSHLVPACEMAPGSNSCDMSTANGFHAMQRSKNDGFASIEDAFLLPGQRGVKEWARLTGLTLSSVGNNTPDNAGFPAWSIAGRSMPSIATLDKVWIGGVLYNVTPKILTTPPANLAPYASVLVEMPLPTTGELSLAVPPNTWVTVLPNF